MAASLPETADEERLSNPSIGKKAKMLQKDFPLLFCPPTALLDSAQRMSNGKVHYSQCQSREIHSYFTTKHFGAEGTEALLFPILSIFPWESPSAWGAITSEDAQLQRGYPSDPASSVEYQGQSR